MKEESLLLLSNLQKLINQVVLIDYIIIILEANNNSIYEKENFLPAMTEMVENALKDGQMDTYLRYLKELNLYKSWAKQSCGHLKTRTGRRVN